MGIHTKPATVALVRLLETLGRILGYHVRVEDPMFEGDKNSPEIDITYRRSQSDQFPLFIVEVESADTKAASDNAVKIFSKDVKEYQKPIFFFHVFMQSPTESHRIESVKALFGKHNYDTYLLTEKTDHLRLLLDILNQHFRINALVDLHPLVKLLENQSSLEVSGTTILGELARQGYDKKPDASFMTLLETLVVSADCRNVREFYIQYLPQYLSHYPRPQQNYKFATALELSDAVHWALLLLLTEKPDYEQAFSGIKKLEKQYSMGLWEPNFGLSRDLDLLLTSEFPLLLTLLAVSFAPTQHAKYFSSRLKDIAIKLHPSKPWGVHSLVWLLLAARTANDKDNYRYARATLNEIGGVPLDLVLNPTVFCGDEPDGRLTCRDDAVAIPDFDKWNSWLGACVEPVEDDILEVAIESFLLMENCGSGRELFARWVLQKSLLQ